MRSEYRRIKAEFEADLFPVLKKTVGIGLLLIVLLVPIFSWVDYFFYPEYFQRFLYYRLVTSAIAAVLFFLNLRSKSLRLSRTIGILGYYTIGIAILFMIKDVNGFGTPYYAGLFLVFTGFLCLLPLDLKSHFLHIFILYFLYLVTVFLSTRGNVPKLFYVNNLFLLSCLAILLINSAISYNKRLDEFIVRRKLTKAEERLRRYAERLREHVEESESKYATVVNNAREGILILKEGDIRYWNPRAKEILEDLGVRLDDNKRFGLLEQIQPQLQREIRSAYKKAVEFEESVVNKEVMLLGPEGEKRWYEYTVVPVRLKSKPAAVAFLRDISAKKVLEEELIQSQKMEAVGVMAGGVAHDLNNVFQILTGYVQMGLELVEKGSRVYYYLSQIERTIKRASGVTRQLLFFARKEESKLDFIDINKQIVSLTKLLHRVVPKMIHIDLELSAEAGCVLADPIQLEQVLLNLCLNARDAMPDGGKLVISTSRVSLNRKNGLVQELKGKGDGDGVGDFVCIKVSDTGVGISPEIKDKIFDPFFTTKEKGSGTGLGLSIVYGIVKDHGGWITCESEVGRGTVFSIFLPACQGDQVNREERKLEHPIATPREGLILLVDDEEQIRDIGISTLTKVGFRVDAVESAEAALEYLEKHGEKVQLILLDLNMPGMGGFRFLKEVRSRFPHHDFKVIICTGYFDRETSTKIKALKVNKIVQKPFKFLELVPVIESILSGLEEN